MIYELSFLEEEEEGKLDYMAGIVDSEGTIYFGGTTIGIHITNTDRRLIKWLKKEFGGSITSRKARKEEWKQQWAWIVTSKNAYKILKKIEGKLLLKNEQCLLCIDMFERVSKHRYKHGKPKPSWAKRLTEEISAKMHVLNKTGIGKTGVLRAESEIKIENNLVYLGGYIDGDGTIGIQKHGDIKLPNYHHRLSVGSTDMRSMEWIKQNYDGDINAYEHKKEEWAKIYKWQISGKKSYKLIKDVRDYLMLKQEQADAVIELYERVTRRNFRSRPAWAIKLQEKLFQRCKKLNKRGVIEEGEENEMVYDIYDDQKVLENWA